MFQNMNKIKDLNMNNRWIFVFILFMVTIVGTVFFISQKTNHNRTAETLITEKNEENNTLSEMSDKVTEGQVSMQIAEKKPAGEPAMRWPGQGKIITGFGFFYSETFNDIRFHPGIDIELPPGYEVRSALSGTVASISSISSSPLWGYEIVIKHGDKLETRYKGIRPKKEKPGFWVERGDIIGSVLTSPKYEAKMTPHLHFEVYEYEKAVDPMEYLNLN